MMRKAAGLTQQQLAEKADVSRVYIQALEGNRRTPSLKLLNKMGEIFKKNPARILDSLQGEWDGKLYLDEILNSPHELKLWYEDKELTSVQISMIKELIKTAIKTTDNISNQERICDHE